MRPVHQVTEVQSLETLNQKGPDDLFICCASFEGRCLSSVSRLSDDFLTKFSVIFLIEEPLYEKEVGENLSKLRTQLVKKTVRQVLVIPCQRQDPLDGVTQFKDMLNQYGMVSAEHFLSTIDISGFTKIYILELLHYLVSELKLPLPRIIHTTQKYSPNKLTRGVEEIATIPHFFGDPSPDKKSLLILFLGFEPERALTVWEYCYPLRTIALLTNPPRNGFRKYLQYAQKNNSYLLSRPSVELRDAPPDNPYEVRNVLEAIWEETHDSFNLTIGPFGTKSQTVGVFLFWMQHPEVRIVYSFPIDYTKSYLRRKPGATILLPLEEI